MKFFLAIFISIFFALEIFAQGASSEEIKAAVKRLGADSFDDRQQATDFLWRQGVAARKDLEQASNSQDPEIRMRAKKVLKKINSGIFPDTPKELAAELGKFEFLSSNEKTGLLNKMAAMGESGWTSLHFLVENQIAKKSFNFWPFLDLLQNNKFLMELLNKSPKWDPLIESILKAAFLNDNFSPYLAWTVENNKLDQRIAEFEKKVDGPKGKQYLKMLAFMYRAAGRLKEAREAAEKARMKCLAFRIALEMEDFEYCLEQYPEMTRNKDGIEPLAWKATLLHLNGKNKEFEKVVGDILQAQELDGNNYQFAAEALLVNEQIPRAIALSRKYDVTGMSLSGFQQHTRDFFAANESFIKEKGIAPLPYIGFLYFHGEKERADELFQKIADRVLKGDNNPQPLPIVVALAIKINHKTKNKLIEFALNSKDVEPKNLAWTIYPGTNFWWEYIEMKYPREDVKQQFKRFLDLMENMPKGQAYIDLLNETSKLLELLPKQQQAGKRITLAAYYRMTGKKQEELTEKMKAAEFGDGSYYMIKVGDWYAEKKNWQKAAEWYKKTLEKYPQEPLALLLYGISLIKIGKEEDGRKKIKVATLFPLGNVKKRLVLAANLEQRENNELALKEYDLIKNMEFYNSWYLIQAYHRIPVLEVKLKSKNAYTKTANDFRLSTFECLSPNIGVTSPLLFFRKLFQYHFYKSKGLLAEKKYEEAFKEFKKTFVLSDINLDDTIDMINKFQQVKEKKFADDIYRKEKERYQENLKLFPKSSDFRNSLAWLMSRTHRELEKALELSKEAVAKSPETSAYLDTLAEVYFHLKNREQAVEWEQKALEYVSGHDREFMTTRLIRFQNDPFPE